MNKYDSPINLLDDNSISLIIKQIEPKSKVLEFGPAAGRMTKYLSQELCCDVFIVEIDTEAYNVAINFAKDGINTNIEDYIWCRKFADHKFDYIIFADVLEHLLDPKEALIRSKGFLKEGGRIITSIPNIAHNSVIVGLLNNKFSYTDTGILDSTHLRFFTYYSLQQLFDDCDLMIITEKMVQMSIEQTVSDYNDLNSISCDQYETMNNRDFANAYQFVFTSVDKGFYAQNSEKVQLCKLDEAKSQNGISLIQSFFIDDGLGFSEANKITRKLILNNNKFNVYSNFDADNKIVNLRFDPCEYACKVKIHSVTSNLSDIILIAQNSNYSENGYDVFMHSDPIYTIKSSTISDVKYISISGEIQNINSYELQNYYNELGKKIIEKEQTMNTLFQEYINKISHLENELIVRNNEVYKANKEIEEIKTLIEEKDQVINIMNKNVELKETQISSLEEEIKKNDIIIQQLNEKVNRYIVDFRSKEEEISQLMSTVDALNLQLNALYNSRSWKMTKSLREIYALIKKIQTRLLSETSKLTEKKLCLIDSGEVKRFYDVSVSIVIPTYNAENYLKPLFDTINNQKGIRRVSIIIVDSGSTDETVRICTDYKVKLIEIPQSEFSHSYARNLGASKVEDEYIIFMTQDALPSNDYWIYNMITPLVKHNVVAVSCIEQPRDNCELAYAVESENFALYLGIYDCDRIGSLPKIQNYETLRRNGQLNDVSCAIVKSVFDQYKYRGDYAEDLDMGVRLIKAGYKIALLSSEKVIHSHNRPCGYYLKRAVVDSKNLKEMFSDFPFIENTSKSILSGIIFAYYKITCTLDYLQNNDFGSTPNEFFGNLQKYFITINSIDKVPVELLQFGKPYSDSIVDDFIKEVVRIFNKDIVEEPYLFGHVIHYTNTTLFKYVKEHYTKVDKVLKDQIIDTIFKRLVSYCGSDLSVYMILHPHDTTFKYLVEDLQKGV